MKITDSTLRRYAKSKLLERGKSEVGNTPIYFHSAQCSDFLICQFSCNGQQGHKIADAIFDFELGSEHKRDPASNRARTVNARIRRKTGTYFVKE